MFPDETTQTTCKIVLLIKTNLNLIKPLDQITILTKDRREEHVKWYYRDSMNELGNATTDILGLKK